jgi:hypothetical protein
LGIVVLRHSQSLRWPFISLFLGCYRRYDVVLDIITQNNSSSIAASDIRLPAFRIFLVQNTSAINERACGKVLHVWKPIPYGGIDVSDEDGYHREMCDGVLRSESLLNGMESLLTFIFGENIELGPRQANSKSSRRRCP